MNTFAPNYSATIKTEFFFSLVHDILEVGIQRYLVLQVYFYKSLLALGVRNALRSIDQIFSSSPEISSRSPLLNTLHYLYNTPEHRNNAFLALYLGQRKAICLWNTAWSTTWWVWEHGFAHFRNKNMSTIIAYVNNWHMRAFHRFPIVWS